MVLGFFLCYIFGELLKIYKKDKKIFFKILSNHGNKFLLILTVLILLDIILTWVSVIYLEIARELNPFILKLWEIYGYDLGEFIYSVILFTIIGILHLFLNSKNDYLILFSFSSIILGIILWFPAVLNNLIILLMNI